MSDELTIEKNFFLAIKYNIWIEMKKYTDGDKWLSSRVSAMNPMTYKSKDGFAPCVFYNALEQFTEVVITRTVSGGANAIYD